MKCIINGDKCCYQILSADNGLSQVFWYWRIRCPILVGKKDVCGKLWLFNSKWGLMFQIPDVILLNKVYCWIDNILLFNNHIWGIIAKRCVLMYMLCIYTVDILYIENISRYIDIRILCSLISVLTSVPKFEYHSGSSTHYLSSST